MKQKNEELTPQENRNGPKAELGTLLLPGRILRKLPEQLLNGITHNVPFRCEGSQRVKEEVQAQGVMERKTYTESQSRSSSDLALEMVMEQNQWASVYPDVNGAAQGRVTDSGAWAQLQRERARIWESNSPADPKASEEGGGAGATGTEIPLQPMVKTMVKQLQPMEVHDGAEIHLQPMEDHTPEQVDAQRRL
ncbi:hypothetical protein BTVI_11474 [Pitangus sulphuratus]|nr:hypothetical protein BTVI_11474 [Pitangus sulphuratus]